MGSFPSLGSLQPPQPDVNIQQTLAIDKPTVANAQQDVAQAPLVAYANKGGVEGGTLGQPQQADLSNKIALSQEDTLKALFVLTPDATVLSTGWVNGVLSSKLGIGAFVLSNPLTNSYTGFVSQPGKGIQTGTPLGRLDNVGTVNLLTGVIEGGQGKAFPLGAGKLAPAVAFINVRGGWPKEGLTASGNFGVFGNFEKLPGGHVVLNALRKSKVQAGVAYRVSVTNLGGGKVKIVASGEGGSVDVTKLLTGSNPEATTTDKPKSANYGDVNQAKYNNYVRYMNGANPYALAETSKGKNNGDLLMGFANNVEQVRKDLEAAGISTGVPALKEGVTRNNLQAGKILDIALQGSSQIRINSFFPPAVSQRMIQTRNYALAFIDSNKLAPTFTEGNRTLAEKLLENNYGNKAYEIPSKEGGLIQDTLSGAFRQKNVDPKALAKAWDFLVGADLSTPPAGFKQEFPGNLRPTPNADLFFKNDWSQKDLRANYGKDPRATLQLDFIKANTSAEFVRKFSSQPGKAVAVSTDGGKTDSAMVKFLKTDKGSILVIQMIDVNGKPASPSVGYKVKADGSLAYP
jgi:hypothetical protein